MNWTGDQERAIRAIDQWLDTADPLFICHGYAGTGKTTIAREFESRLPTDFESMDGEEARVETYTPFLAYTGKAASVLRRKGVGRATTIHRLLYMPRRSAQAAYEALGKELDGMAERGVRPDAPEYRAKYAEYKRVERSLNNLGFVRKNMPDIRLVIIDECSMVGPEIGFDLDEVAMKILAFGDPAQLPPIDGRGHFDEEPRVLLEQITRQAAESPIIRASMDVREGRWLDRHRH